jgi:glyceraldehyde 3-phosphate dehydrogenase
VINGNPIRIIYADTPDEINYQAYGINKAIVIDNTGLWNTTNSLQRHRRPCPEKVLLTAPAGDDIPNVDYGINHHQITSSHKIISAASCTTNAIVPILHCMLKEYGIEQGMWRPFMPTPMIKILSIIIILETAVAEVLRLIWC